MGTLSDSNFPNLANWASVHQPDGAIGHVTDILSKEVAFLDDIPWVEANGHSGHIITHTTNSLPSATWRSYNAGAARIKTEHEQFMESAGMLESWIEVDKKLADLAADKSAYMMTQMKGAIEGIGQQVGTSFFYESTTTNPERVHGMSPRYAATSGATTSDYVSIGGSNADDNCHSIWLITWAENICYGFYPKGSSAGLSIKDLGEQRIEDSSNNPYLVYSQVLNWDLGFAVEDYRYLVRYQWDPDEELVTEKTLYIAMQDMLTDVYKLTPQSRFYMNRTSFKRLMAQLGNNESNYLGWITPQGQGGGAGMPIATFMGVPIRVTDSLVAETAIS